MDALPQHADPMFDPTSAPARRRGHAVIAWIVIVAAVIGAIWMHREKDDEFAATAPAPQSAPGPSNPATSAPASSSPASAPSAAAQPPAEDELGVMLMTMQAKYMVGASATDPEGAGGLIYATAKPLNAGTIPQRQRFIVLAAELKGPAEAATRLAELDGLIAGEEKRAGNGGSILRPDEAKVQQALRHMLDGATDDAAIDEHAKRVAALSSDDRAAIANNLDWMGRLALAPRGTSEPAERQALVDQAMRLVTFVVGAFVGVGALGVAGFFGLIAVVVLIFTGKVRSGIHVGAGHHGIYAETFALWMVLFFGLQVGVGKLAAAAAAPGLDMLFVVAAFFASLAALIWPVIRGVPWRDVRQDIGWTLAPNAWTQPVFGVIGYAMGLPILGVGLLITLGLLLLQKAMTGEPDVFGPTAGPAHPILMELAGPDLWPKIQVIILGAIAAPIVEETMFRGVLYRHLRDASRSMGIFLSVLMSGLLSSFVFAAIHPQGFVAIPALMGLAVAFALMREWRGSVLPSMIIHGISNFIVLTGVSIALSN